ncbi:MAG: ribosomal L7Ae/L30e/S12e/Gadd45 family protein [Eubacterium sp.]|nr:ribosomal L7Ae/L30e/S12e/Gadd45 family protein [Candidatus Colimonas fimequi]
MNKKIISYLGFARKAGKLISGVGTCTFELGKGKVKLMILAEDISENSEKKIMKEIRRADVPFIKMGTIEEMSKAVGASDRSVFGICDKGFAEAILKEAKSESK